MTSGTPPFVIVERVSKRYGRLGARFVLRQACAEFGAGEVHVIVGPSGSGKTTLLNLVGGIDRPDEGRIVVGGVTVSGLRESGRAGWRARTVGTVFQQPFLPRGWRAWEAVAAPLLAGLGVSPAEGRRRAVAMLETVGLGEESDRRVEHLSGGQRQRVALARALVPRPALVLADEPTAHQDRESGRRVARLLAEAARRDGTTVLAVSHEAEGQHWLADRRWVLEEGTMKEEGRVQKEEGRETG
ncbi:MAG: ATP-binding cassette domain-containing protein [Candidatus Sumerlaeia bacterium]|nr:ATP-binding cassette domain-containing protein [Candidatus Sumerlaeia bacterium]